MAIYVVFWDSMLAITTISERIDHWIKMRRSLAKFSESEASNHTPSLADFTTTTPELKFSVHTGTVAGDQLSADPGVAVKANAENATADAVTVLRAVFRTLWQSCSRTGP